MFCYFYFFRAIAYMFIIDVTNVVIEQMFFYRRKIEITKLFISDYERKFDILHLINFWLYILIKIVFSFQKFDS